MISQYMVIGSERLKKLRKPISIKLRKEKKLKGIITPF